MNGRLGAVLLPALGVALAVGLWWLATAVFPVDAALVPGPGAVLGAFRELPGYLLAQAGHTLVEVLEGFAAAVVAGAFIALALTGSRVVERMAFPLLLALNSVPKVAVAPLLVLWFGFGQLPKVIMVFLVCFFPVVISMVSGLAATPPEFVELARSLEAPGWQAFVKVRVPSALPQVFVGLKVGMTLAVIGAVISEFQAGTVAGLGFVIAVSTGQTETAQTFAAVVLLALLSIVLYYGLVAVERLVIPWSRP
ncbi:ABC transporter permease [Actinoplanes sp. NPDC051411]|uniref:ABC transporter permease n=1 Tax=Actinoplanes sp. NPDC051411 TaxID=3155522 RepID=UPI00341BF8B8